MGGGGKRSSGEEAAERESTGPGCHLCVASHTAYLDLIPGVKDLTPGVDARQAVQMYLPRQDTHPPPLSKTATPKDV